MKLTAKQLDQISRAIYDMDRVLSSENDRRALFLLTFKLSQAIDPAILSATAKLMIEEEA
jgi:hypothetical protein